MTTNNIDLEDKIFYRLVKVFYIFFLIIFLLGVFFLGYSSIPKRYIDNEKSYLVCENGIYPFKKVGIHFWGSGNKFFSNDFDEDAKNACEEITSQYLRKKELIAELERRGQHYTDTSKKNLTPEIARAELKRREMIQHANHPPYVLSTEFITEGGWVEVFCWWFLGSGIIYITLNVIRNTLVYVAFGKKFTWDWLKNPYYFCRIKYLTLKNRA